MSFRFLYVDLISSSFVWLTAGAAMLAYLSCANIGRKLWWLLLRIIILRFTASRLLLFYILFELRLIPILLIILFWGTQPERMSARLYFIIYTGIFSIPFLLVVLLLIKELSFFLDRTTLITRIRIRVVLLIPFLVKIPVFGLHFWLPKAHVEASTRGSIILAGLLLKLGSYGALRIVLLSELSFFLKSLSLLWLVTTICRRTITIIQRDIKKLVAYRRVSHMTFLIVGLSSRRKSIFMVTIIVSLAHGWASIGIFARAGIFSHAVHSRLRKLFRPETKIRRLAILIGVLLLSNASIPPFPSFFPELSLVHSLLVNAGIVSGLFVILSLIVCYFNAFIFMCVSHKSRNEIVSGLFKLQERVKLSFLVILTMISLVWLKRL